MEPQQQPEQQQEGEFHHFQLVSQDGEVPMSITLLLHINRNAAPRFHQEITPIGANDVLALHEALRKFDGNFIKAFKKT